MTFGVELYTKTGEKFFSTDAQTWNYIGSFIAPANGSITMTFPNMSIMKNFLFQRSAVDNPPKNQEGYIHDVDRSGNDVIASGGTIRTLVVVLGK